MYLHFRHPESLVGFVDRAKKHLPSCVFKTRGPKNKGRRYETLAVCWGLTDVTGYRKDRKSCVLQGFVF